MIYFISSLGLPLISFKIILLGLATALFLRFLRPEMHLHVVEALVVGLFWCGVGGCFFFFFFFFFQIN